MRRSWIALRQAARSPLLWSALSGCLFSLSATAYSSLDAKIVEAPGAIEMRGPQAAELGDINRQLQLKNYDAVVRRAREIVARQPQSALAHEVLGTALLLSGDTAHAAEALKKAVQLNPNASGPLLRLATLQMDTNELGAAEASLKKALALSPNDRFAHQRLGLLYEHQQKNALAIEHFRKGLIGTPPQYLGVAVNLGRLLNEHGQYPATLDTLGPRAPLSADSTAAHESLGTAHLAVKEYRAAAARFERALALDADLRGARLGQIIALRELGKAADALAAAERLTSRQPNWGDAWLQQGETLLTLDRIDDAKRALDRGAALQKSPAAAVWPLIRYNLRKQRLPEADALLQALQDGPRPGAEIFAQRAEILQALGQHERGLATLQAGIGKYPGSTALHFRLGNYQAALGHYDAAVAALRRALQLAPNNPNVLKTLSMVQARAGDRSGAIDSARQLYRLFPDELAEAVFYGARLEDGGRTVEAEALYRQLLQRIPDNALLLNNLASLLANKGSLTEAESLARKAIRQVATNGLIWDTLGWTLYQQKRYEEASRALEKAVQLADNVPVIWYHRGLALEALKKDSAAKQSLQRAIALEPNAAWADEVRRRL